MARPLSTRDDFSPADRGTKTELAERLGVTVKRITRAMERGDIARERIGINDRPLMDGTSAGHRRGGDSDLVHRSLGGSNPVA